MKRLSIFFLVLVVALLISVTGFTEGDFFSAMGYLESKDYTLSADTAITIEAAWVAGGGTWKRNGQAPKAITLQPETYGIRIAFGGQTPSVDNVGTVISALAVGRWPNPSVQAAKICNASAGQNAKVHMIVER